MLNIGISMVGWIEIFKKNLEEWQINPCNLTKNFDYQLDRGRIKTLIFFVKNQKNTNKKTKK